MAYQVIDNFKQGMVRYANPLSLPPGTLYYAVGCALTQGGEAEKNQDVLALERYQVGTQNEFYGLIATKDYLYTFGSTDYPAP